MGNSAVDYHALTLGLLLGALIATALVVAYRSDNPRRLWVAGAALAAVLSIAGLVDLLRATPRETHVATALVGAILPVLGALGVVRAARRARWWIRWILAFVTAVVLLFGGLVLGATLASRLLG